MAEAKNTAMRDIRSDLQERAVWIQGQIKAEQDRFELLTAQVKMGRTQQLKDLRSQLEAVTRLLQLATWHHNVRMATTRALALAATAEIAALEFSQSGESAANVRL